MSEERGHAVPAEGAREALAEADPQEEFAEIEVDAPVVGIVMGSKSDMETMEAAERELRERGIGCEVRVMSAHRDPDVVAEYAKNARMRGLRVIIAGAGLSAALPGVVAAHTDLPVIGVPLTSKTSVGGGLDAVPAGVDVFHAGTAERGGDVVTAGGRVLNVTALGDGLGRAREAAYAAADMIAFDGMQLRRDIAGG